ncbi:MAG: DUF6011 domain-containing protein [Actinomycetota bacterium]|nr:DUF6011 domain-containing protein [Actinomycetota bacterium]
MPELLDRVTILAAFAKLDSELARRRRRADLFVVGGAAMVLVYDQDLRARTRDVDAVFADVADVYDAAHTVARRMGLPADWLNDAVRSYMLGDDPEATPVWEGPSLQVAVGSPRYILAMKLLAARPEQDRDDIDLLFGLLGYTAADQGISLLLDMLPGRRVPDRTIDLLEAMYGPVTIVPDGEHRSVPSSPPAPTAARCRACGRPLRSAASIALGVGPTCARRAVS